MFYIANLEGFSDFTNGADLTTKLKETVSKTLMAE